MTELDRPIPDSYWVEPNRLLAGEFPAYAYGHHSEQRIEAFLEAGIDTFIDLTDPNELPSYLPLLKEIAGYYDLSVRYKRFAIQDFGLPTSAIMIAILNEIDASLAAEHKVYVHCWGGIGRTGTTVGCYLVRHGRTGEQAIRQLAEWWKDVPKSRLWPRSPETERQVEFILNWNESPRQKDEE